MNTSTSVSLGLTPSSGPYWNAASSDGANYNIGWCLAGGGNCPISNAPGNLTYYGNTGNGTATAASNLSFSESGVAQEVSLRGLFSNQSGSGLPPSGIDYFGWYSIGAGGAIGPLNQLLSSTQAVGTTSTFMPTTNYGFYLENVQSPGTSYIASYFWFLNDSQNSATGTGIADAGIQHFSIFGAPGSSTYYLGLEDTVASNSDFDYNDLIVELQPAPEPAALTLMLAGLGLVAFAICKHRV